MVGALIGAVLLPGACGKEAPPMHPGWPGAALRAPSDPRTPIIAVEYGDDQCLFCAVFARETQPQIEARHPDATSHTRSIA